MHQASGLSSYACISVLAFPDLKEGSKTDSVCDIEAISGGYTYTHYIDKTEYKPALSLCVDYCI